MIKNEDRNELLGNIIDIFEDFLEEHNVDIDNPEKNNDQDNPAIIYGTDYSQLEQELSKLLENWDILEKE